MNETPIDKTTDIRDGRGCCCLGTWESGKGVEVNVINRSDNELDQKDARKLSLSAKAGKLSIVKGELTSITLQCNTEINSPIKPWLIPYVLNILQ